MDCSLVQSVCPTFIISLLLHKIRNCIRDLNIQQLPLQIAYEKNLKRDLRERHKPDKS